MKKIGIKIAFIISLMLTILFGLSLTTSKVYAETNTSSDYVNTLTELETTDLYGGATLYEQKMSSLLNGNSAKQWQEHFVQWVDFDNYEGLQLVTWTNQSKDYWTATTTRKCAEDWENSHPGWIVVAGINGDFFQNSGTITWEPTNNFMADGDMYRADYVGAHRKIVGFTDENEIIVGDPTLSSLMQLHIYDENGEVEEKLDIAGYNTAPSETGVTLYTKDATSTYDLTGYTVYVGRYSICRVSNGTNKTVFVKGDIETVREGTAADKPEIAREVEENGELVKKTFREFYLVTKDSSYAEKLEIGTSVKCQYDYVGSWSEVTQSVGYNYELLLNGVSQHQNSTISHVYTDHPRTFIGFKEDGTAVLMVVDGRGGVDNKGVSLFEGGEIMKLAGCVNAYNLDGGGSSTLIVRNESGNLEVINRPSDGSERSTGNAVFLVMRDPAVYSSKVESTPTTVTFHKDTTKYAQSVSDIVVSIDGKDYPMTGDSVTATGLDINTKYDAKITYTQNGETCVSKINVETKQFTPGVEISATHNTFNINVRKTDEYLKIIGIKFTVNDKTYQMGNTDTFVIDGLLKGTEYSISYTYVIENQETKETYDLVGTPFTYSTLTYQIPSLTNPTVVNITSAGKVNINYEYIDPDGMVTKAYFDISGTEYEVSKKSGMFSVSGLDLDNQKYNAKLVIIYELPNGKEYTVESDEILIEKHIHEWEDATCETPKTCKTCGETEGFAKGHDYEKATCETPKTCKVCGKTDGDAQGHMWIDATYSAPKTCIRCNKTEGEPLVKEEKKGCKKSSIATMILSIGLLSSGLYFIRRKK